MIMAKVSFDELMAVLKGTLEELDGNDIADIYNHVCCKKIRYLEKVGQWEYTGEDDSVEVI
jgi:DNA-binding protein Fis